MLRAGKRSARLRAMLHAPQLQFLMEAHNDLSARIVREAGFQGLWASGLALSAHFGVRDNNEASWTQIVDMLEFMVDASDLPVLLDGDTHYAGALHNLFSFDAVTTRVDIEITPFVDAGRVFRDASTFPLSHVHPVGGIGFRGIARPFVVGYVDIGYGSEGMAIFTGINYPF